MLPRASSIPRCCSARGSRRTCCRSRGRSRSPVTSQRIPSRVWPGRSRRASRTTRPRFEQLRARLARTIDYIKSIPASAFEGSETRDIKVPAGERTLEFKGLDFLQTWVIPNVFFHVTTAYNILRHNGVDLGKADFIGGGRKL